MLNADTLLKSVEGYVFSITLSWTGATAGDKVYLVDDTQDSSADPSKHLVVFVLDAANGTYAREWTQGKKFTRGLFYKEGTAANVFTEITYK